MGTNVYDVVIVGGGPAGATAALYAARADLKTLVLDKGVTAGALGMAGQIANYPGVPGPISGAELVGRIREQAASFGAEFVTDKVMRLDLSVEPRQVWGGQSLYEGRVVIIATGAMGRTSYLPGEQERVGRGVAYCATCDAAFFRGREVAVVGNNDEAVEEALVLARFASHVHFLSPTAELKVSPKLAEDLSEQPQVTLHLGARVREIAGEGKVEQLRIAERGEERMLPVSGVFVYLQGNVPVTDFVYDQLPRGEGGCLVVGQDFQTALPGVYAIGDVLCERIRQVSVSTAQGVAAAMAADRFLRGRDKPRSDWN